ncbi:hypothetical protein [Micromonospora vulcania]|uniref:Uncharacterized protein n=1 Tax=Micromonospora vulcania TaxID=1441873 RepID=A0ABW1HF58_9ACTN
MRLLPPSGPARILTLGTLVKTVGRGLWLVASALFLTRSVGLSPTQVGVGLTISALVGVLASTPSGFSPTALAHEEYRSARYSRPAP